jgi:lipopolysaccharide export system protein LptA
MRCQKVMKTAIFSLALALAATSGQAQDTNVAFAGLKTDVSQPVQVDADQLSVNQEDGTATFSGNVVVVQGDMRLQAGEVTIVYSTDNRAIESLHAEGGVTLAAGTDAATAQTADYRPDTGDLVLIGDVVLTQGAVALSGQKLTLSLTSGTGTMSGRVTTIFTPGNN